jgi:DNA-binding NtrC family response regulator
MPSYAADETAERPPINRAAFFGLSPIDRESIGNLVGHTLARIEREFNLQTLRSHRRNRTRTTDRPGISIRSLRNEIRDYQGHGETVPEPANRPS